MPKPMKRKGALVKLLGTAVLFVAFTTQNFLYETWRSAGDELRAAQTARSIIDKGALINEGHFYLLSALSLGSAVPDQTAMAEYKIRQYALKIYQSEVINISSSGKLTLEQKRRYIDALQVEAGKVKDYASAARFTDFLNKQAEPYQQAYNKEVAELSERRSFAKWAYLFVYALGSLMILAGLYYDWKGVEE